MFVHFALQGHQNEANAFTFQNMIINLKYSYFTWLDLILASRLSQESMGLSMCTVSIHLRKKGFAGLGPSFKKKKKKSSFDVT